MAERDPLHQPNTEQSSLGSNLGIQGFKSVPLLPYERDLAKHLGWSIDDYRKYRQELINYSRKRPAAYSKIPDIQCDPTGGILTSLVIGIALSAVSALLAPKPKQQQEDAPGSRQLGSSTGRTRFNNTTGFDTVQDIVTLGTPIPILFGRFFQDLGTKEVYGGLYASPQLAWSRMFSYGTHQGFKGLYILGETTLRQLNEDQKIQVPGIKKGSDKPPLSGISYGTTPLQSLNDRNYAFYFRSNYDNGRIKASDLYYGTRGTPSSGDPETNDDIFTSPIQGDPYGKGFCMTYLPNNSIEFGCYGGIRNGTAYRVNFKVVPFPKLNDQDDDPSGRIRSERRKIAGEYFYRGEGMGGLGRGYSPLMGIESLNGWNPSDSEENVAVSVGDTCVFRIRGKQYEDDELKIDFEDYESAADEINNTLNSERAATDDLLQIGGEFMIGRTVWKVISRGGGKNGIWEVDGEDIVVTLEMIETTGGEPTTVIGIAGKAGLGYLRSAGDGALGVTSEGGTFNKADGWCGEAFWPLTRYALGVVRNARLTDMTEIGIRSQVWNRAEGLCNFATLPTASELTEYEDEGITIQSGTMTQYMGRTSFFTIFMRPVDDENPQEWRPINEAFCVSGSSPVDQFNFVRIKSNEGAKQMEFRFIPKSGADVAQFTPDDKELLRLNAKTGVEIGGDYTVAGYGTFRVTIVGDIIKAASLKLNPEMTTSGKVPKTIYKTIPTDIGFVDWLPRNQSVGRSMTFYSDVLGKPQDNTNQTRSGTFVATSGSRTLTIRVTCRSYYTEDSGYYSRFQTRWYWVLFGYQLVGYTGSWNIGEQAEAIRSPLNGNGKYFANRAGYDTGGAVFTVSRVETSSTLRTDAERVFSFRSQQTDVSHYTEFKSSNYENPEHTIVYVNESIRTPSPPNYPLTIAGVAVRSSKQLSSLDQLNIWVPNGVNCYKTLDKNIGPSNLFSDLAYYLLRDPVGGLGRITSPEWLIEESFKNTSQFLLSNRYFFDGAIENRVNLRSYLTELAPFFLCNFVIANGQFSIVPAVPYDKASGAIDPRQITIAAIFTAGNIIEGTYELSYLDRADRERFKAVVKYRVNPPYKAPTTAALLVRYDADGSINNPIEEFDLTAFCTSRDHATAVGKYMISIRRRIDHAISFETTPYELRLAPGDYIRVVTESMPTDPTRIGSISAKDGRVLSAAAFKDGTYTFSVYLQQEELVRPVEVEIVNNRVVNESYWGTIFSTLTPREESTVYIVEQLEMTDSGTVAVTASHHPVILRDGVEYSVIAEDVLSDDRFVVSDGIDA